MRTPVATQLWRISVFFLLGSASFAIFQFYTAFRSVFNPKKSANAAFEFLMGLFLASGLAMGIFLTSWGEVRYYIPFSMAAGCLSCYFFTGDIFYGLARTLFLYTVQVKRTLAQKIFRPAKKYISDIVRRLIPPKPEPPDIES